MVRGWMLKGAKMGMWMWRVDWMLLCDFASRCIAMAMALALW